MAIEMALFGAGRIGEIHAANIAHHPAVRLRYVVGGQDANRSATLAAKYGAAAVSADVALGDGEVQAVAIASPTPTHPDLIIKAAGAGKAIFCEKPIALNLQQLDDSLAAVKTAGVPFFLGFNRRFDPSFSQLHTAVKAGQIGSVEMVNITSRDPAPPPLEYLQTSGGIFADMVIHDFDMARWLLGEEPTEIFATASCLVNPEIAQLGDADTAMIILKTMSGKLSHINVSRRAVYGYDQRIEVFGSAGMVQAGNHTPTTVELATANGVSRDKPLHFFLERYAAAYQREIDHFVDIITKGVSPLVGGDDGRKSLILAEAAKLSATTNQPVKL
ncbi:MAG TPA: inositol 2-dehydrogenase [Oscillatoriaceae cyanobacterium M33_DOE_052]|uniref:Inositol 2-dehydrogenase n=1 Tax=Planktothricoides sp. SpSt-374 TaxID=2282167 RepID=A0A7C3ZP10_9CYAN|nr:inositol 2-dehydrogenase [Oscillatoriaceae cyanobacterium M33_DOE_052]